MRTFELSAPSHVFSPVFHSCTLQTIAELRLCKYVNELYRNSDASNLFNFFAAIESKLFMHRESSRMTNHSMSVLRNLYLFSGSAFLHVKSLHGENITVYTLKMLKSICKASALPWASSLFQVRLKLHHQNIDC